MCCLTLLACLCCIVASAQQQTVNVRLRNATLAQLFKVIERQTTYVFSYQSNALDNLGGITINRRDATVPSVLNEAELRHRVGSQHCGDKIQLQIFRFFEKFKASNTQG